MTESYLQNLVKYIKKNLSKGYTMESLKWALINQGYSRSEVEKSIKIANEQLSLQAPRLLEKPIIKVEAEPLQEIQDKSFWEKIRSWFS